MLAILVHEKLYINRGGADKGGGVGGSDVILKKKKKVRWDWSGDRDFGGMLVVALEVVMMLVIVLMVYVRLLYKSKKIGNISMIFVQL
jgi:hypothetical protein